MLSKTKTGSSRRKGDQYQDLTALQLVLEAYIAGHEFQVFIEYEKAGSLDDVVVLLPNFIDGYQVKHAVSDNAVYIADDFTKTDSVVFIEKYAKSWRKLVKEFQSRHLKIHLRSNRALDAQLAAVVTDQGFFDEKFRLNNYRKEKRKLRAAIFEASGLSEVEFQQFLFSFHFDLKQPSWLRLEQHIKAELLDHKLGVSDRRIFADLKRLIERHAIEIADPITPQIIDSFLRDTQTRYLLPQSFAVDHERFVKPPTLNAQLDEKLKQADAEYIVITGPPGSGKSTALTEYCAKIEKDESDRFIIVRYYCFVRVHDNRQRMRLEAKSLRVNLLTELQRRFPEVLDKRRYDYSEGRFYDAFEAIGNYCGQIQKKLVVFLDGLDHVERDEEVRDSIIASLPAELPQNVVFLIGTQELNRWIPLALREGRQKRHIKMPLFTLNETQTYIADRCGIAVPDGTTLIIFQKSAGLPLYLRYLAELLSSSDDPDTTIDTVPAAVDGDVHTYYETLWAAFETENRTDAKYLSSVLASLRFRVHKDELIAFQIGIPDTPRFDLAYRQVRHLLRNDDELISVFHNSFRVFVMDQMDTATLHEIASGILSCLKLEEFQSARWFKYACCYAFEAGEYGYILANINHGFVDTALIRFRSQEEIKDGIEYAIKAAGKKSDLVALSRLGSLKFRTHERLEHTFPWSELADILLYQGRVDQVVDSIYSEETNRVIANEEYAIGIILRLVDLGMHELGSKLFSGYLKNSKRDKGPGNQGVVALAHCLGVFKIRPVQVMRWLSNLSLQRDILEPEELTIEYAPHLEAYLDGLVRGGHDRIWKKFKRLNTPFSNRLIRQLIVRAIARWKSNYELQNVIEEYVANYEEDTNIELAFYAAKAGFPITVVNQLAGRFIFPVEIATHEIMRTELLSQIRRFAYWAVIFGYEQNDKIIKQIQARIREKEAVWACTQVHLLKVGEILGSHFSGREINWFFKAKKAVEALEIAGHTFGERTPDALDAARSVLGKSLLWLSEVVVARCRDRLGDWVMLLEKLRSSFIWTCHYGFGEPETNYFFEFPIWEKQTDISEIQRHIRPVLVHCAKSYDEALSMKGGMRSGHFLSLAALAAKCGFKTDSSLWLKRGVESNLAYGYRKDVTLEYLTDVLTLLGKYRPKQVLKNAAAILEMIKWVHNATDGRSTKHFSQYLLPTIIVHNRAAALEALRTYYKEFATWQANESIEKYILARHDGDPEFLWALCGLLDPNKSLEVRQHVIAVATSDTLESNDSWAERLSIYIKSMINPRHWPDELWEEATRNHGRPARRRRYEGSNHDEMDVKEYKLEGQSITLDEAKERCCSSFNEMVNTIDKLKLENDYIPDYNLYPAIFDHIDNATNIHELKPIRSFFEEQGRWREADFWEKIGNKYLDLGDITSSLECLERAIHENPKSDALTTLIEYDRERAETFIVGDLTERLQGPSYNCFDAPNVVANVCDLLGREEALEEVFDDFLQHCKELFAQWPKDRSFDGLRDWDNDDCDEDIQIIHLLVDRLESHEVEFGKRLICSICMLAEKRSEKVIPVLAERMSSVSGLRLWRMLQIFNRLSYSNLSIFREYCHVLIPLLESGNVFLALTALNAIKTAYTGNEPMPERLRQSIEKTDRRYSSLIMYRGFGIIDSTPSEDFVQLTKRGALFSFRRQLKAVCQILNLNLEAITAKLECKLLETGTTLDEEKDTARSMANAFVHPQGWPILWYVSDFHVQISDMFYRAIDEVLSKQRYQPNHLEAIWRVIQPNDPEYSDAKLSPMPGDISPLCVEAKDEWIALDRPEPVVSVEDTFHEEWITAFEYRELAQDSPYHREIVLQLHGRSSLIVPEEVDNITSFELDSWGEKVGTHHPSENLTWQQFRDALNNGHQLEPDGYGASVPFVAFCEKNNGFLGFHTIASLSSKIIRDQELWLDGFSAFSDEECVACFEAWQEGYPDEDYNDVPLSFGVRLRVRTKFVKKVCQTMGRAFATQTIENRFILKDYQAEPSDSSSRTSIDVYPVDVVQSDNNT